MSEPVVALVVAAGLGRRFGGSAPKTTLEIFGRPIVALSIDALAAGGCTHVVVVANPATLANLETAVRDASIPVAITLGGASRQESVWRGLDLINNDPHLAAARAVLVHDAVRPMVPASVVAAVISALDDGAAAVAPVVKVVDTMRILTGENGGSALIDRNLLRAVQTPQGFDLQVLTQAHAALRAEGGEVTDDLSCCERYGHQVTLVAGSPLAMKITEPQDLAVAKTLWGMRANFGHHAAPTPGESEETQ